MSRDPRALLGEPTYKAGPPAPDGRFGRGAGGRQRCLKAAGPEHAGQRSFEVPLFCGFFKKLLAFSWLPATSRLRAHVTSHPTPKASHLEPSSPDVCVWGGGYVLNHICIQTQEQRRGRLCFGTACLQACICAGFCLRKLPASLHNHPTPDVSSPAPTPRLQKVLCSPATVLISACRWRHLLRHSLPASAV